MKKVLCIVLSLVLVLALAACASPAASNAESSSETTTSDKSSAVTVVDASKSDTEMVEAKDSYTVAMIYQDLSQEFNIYFQNVMSTRCAEAGITLLEFDGRSDTETQLNQCENAIASGADALLFIPFDKDGAAPIIDNCNEAGIPVICCNNITTNVDQATAYVGANDVEAGIMETEYIVDLIGGKGNIAVVEGPFGHSAQVARQEGLEQVLAGYPDCKIVWMILPTGTATRQWNLLKTGLQAERRSTLSSATMTSWQWALCRPARMLVLRSPSSVLTRLMTHFAP